MLNRSRWALAPVSAALVVAGCSATPPTDEAQGATKVTVTNCGLEKKYSLPITKVLATSNSANIGTVLKVGGLDKLAAVSLNTDNDAVMTSMFGPGIEKVKHLASSSSSITMETVLGAGADLVIGSYSGLFKGATGVTPQALESKGIASYTISDSCRQSDAENSAMGTMDPWDALRADITNYGKLFQTESTATTALAELNSRLSELRAAPKAATAPRVLIYDSGEEDLYTSGRNGAPNGIIDAAGGTNVFGTVDNTWFRASWETVAAANPDVIVVMDYRKGGDEVPAKLAAIKARAGLKDSAAVRNDRFVVLPLAMFTSGYPNIYGAQLVRKALEGYGLVPKSGIDFAGVPNP